MSAREGQLRLTVIPITLRDANATVNLLHRHHPGARVCVFCIAVVDETGYPHGVAIVGRPVARSLQDGLTAEVTRLATDGTPNACSALYGRCARDRQGYGLPQDHHLHPRERAGHVAQGCWLAAGWNRQRAYVIVPVAPEDR